VLKAGQERERTKNDAQAYANQVVPLAAGTSSRLKEESEAYKARIVAQAQGDAGRFSAVLAEYQKAPQVTRDRMYTDAMQQIYASTTKVLVDTKQGSNLLYLPLDKLMQASGNNQATPVDAASPSVAGTAPAQSSVIPVAPAAGDNRARDGRSRDRDVR
jgi:membrane protease subunit HflK